MILATSITCYNCESSSDLTICEASQTKQMCQAANSVCMTLENQSDLDKSPFFSKSCMKKSACENYCKLPGVEDDIVCEVIFHLKERFNSLSHAMGGVTF